MITKLQFIDPERLDKEEGSGEAAWTSLGRRNRKNIASRLQVSGDRRKRHQESRH